MSLDVSKLPDSPQVSDAIYTGIGKGDFKKAQTGISGYTVESLLSAAGVEQSNVNKITFADNTGFSRTFTGTDLFQTRFSYGYETDSETGNITSFKTDEKTEVPVIITSDSECQLVFGQVDTSTLTTNNWVKGVTKITVTTSNWFAQGSGTTEDPYVVNNETDLKKVSANNKCYKLGNDIKLTGIWTPIGGENAVFSGTFDGNGKTISGLNVTADGYAGFFGNVSGTVKNLKIRGSVKSTSEKDYFAGIVARLQTGGTIQNCIADVNVTAESGYNAGGIAGFTGSSSDLSSKDNTTISNCISYGNICAQQHVGGIAGYNNGLITNSANKGKITHTYVKKGGAGGIAGFNGNNNDAASAGTITACYNTGEIYAGNNGSWCGGIAGFNNAKSSISSCYSVGMITNVYAYFGGLVGNQENASEVSGYSLQGIPSDSKGFPGTEKTSEEMKADDFVSLLGTGFAKDSSGINGGYPILSGEIKYARDFSEATVNLSKTSYTYTGKIQKPAVTVNFDGKSLTKGSDYTVTYPNGCKLPGTYTVKATGKGSYAGTISKNYRIAVKPTAISKLKKAKKAFTVKVAKQSKMYITGYQVRYSLKSDMAGAKTKTISKKYSKVSKKISKLKAKKTYYVQVRTYKSISGKKYYSDWSAKKSIKTR